MSRDYFQWDHLRLRYRPFPIGIARPVMDASVYQELLDAWPSSDRFQPFEKVGDKLTLSEKLTPEPFQDFIRHDPVWREFHQWMKSDLFIGGVLDVLRENEIELGFEIGVPKAKRLRRRVRDLLQGRLSTRSVPLSARLEFSMLPAKGGHILPHTDGVAKIVTLVVAMLKDGEWNPAWGGGTDLNLPKDERLTYNHMNRQLGFDEMEVLDTYAFEPNQAVLFVKTFNSWHSVRPMTCDDPSIMRRTLTINIVTPS